MCASDARGEQRKRGGMLAQNVKRLSTREYQALVLFAGGKKRSEAAEFMDVSVNSYRVYLANVVKKLRARNMNHAVYLATVSGLLVFPDIRLPD